MSDPHTINPATPVSAVESVARLEEYLSRIRCAADGSVIAPLNGGDRLVLRLTMARVAHLEQVYASSFVQLVQSHLLSNSDRLSWAHLLMHIRGSSFDEAAKLVRDHGTMVLAALIVAVNHFLNPFEDVPAAMPKKKSRRQLKPKPLKPQ